MLDALNRAERCRDAARECRRLAATSPSRQMRHSRMAEHHSLLAEVEQFVRSVVVAIALLGVVTAGVAFAETARPSSPTSSFIDDVSNWASEQWDWAKAEWAKGKEKWADCQKQSNDQNLSGPGSWLFLGGCMTRPRS